MENTMAERTWTTVPDGEYNEQFTVKDDVKITIYSDRDGEAWMCRIGEADDLPLEATTLYAARREALAPE
jgi:hypothetical protein